MAQTRAGSALGAGEMEILFFFFGGGGGGGGGGGVGGEELKHLGDLFKLGVSQSRGPAKKCVRGFCAD